MHQENSLGQRDRTRARSADRSAGEPPHRDGVGVASPDADHVDGAGCLNWRTLPWLLILTHVTLIWLARAPGMLTGQDDARYLVLGRAIREGVYRDLMWPGAPLHHMYPPGYPLLLAIWSAVGGEQFEWLLVLQVLVSATTLLLVFDATRRAIGRPIALGVLAALAVNPALVESSGQIASEGSLALCFAIAFWATHAMAPGRRQVAVVLAATIAAPMMRSAGIVLPAAVTMYLLLQRRYRDAAVVGTISALGVGALLWWTLSDPVTVAGSSYAADLMYMPNQSAGSSGAPSFLIELLRRVKSNLVFYPTQGLPWILPTPTIAGTIADNVLFASLTSLAMIIGLARGVRQLPLAAWVVLATSGLLLLWPYQAPRFAVPLLPVMLPILLLGVATATASWKNTSRQLAVGVAVLVVAGTGLVRSIDAVRSRSTCRPPRSVGSYNCQSEEQVGFFQAAQYVRDSLGRDARVLSAKSEPLFVYSGKLTVPFLPLADLDSAGLWNALRRDSVDYVLLTALQSYERPRLAPRLAERCHELALVKWFAPHAYLFRLVRTPPLETAPQPADRSVAPSDSVACRAIARYRADTGAP